MEADQGPQVSRLGLGDGSGSGQTLQVRGRVLGHQECLPGNNHFRFLEFTNYFFLHTLPLFKFFCQFVDNWSFVLNMVSIFSLENMLAFLIVFKLFMHEYVSFQIASGGFDDPAVSLFTIFHIHIF